jgi:hypothetical protein
MNDIDFGLYFGTIDEDDLLSAYGTDFVLTEMQKEKNISNEIEYHRKIARVDILDHVTSTNLVKRIKL